jgi:hypothetical protein
VISIAVDPSLRIAIATSIAAIHASFEILAPAVATVGPAIAVFVAIEFIFFYELRALMSKAGYPPPQIQWGNNFLIWASRLIRATIAARQEAAAWYVERDHLRVAWVAFAIAISGLVEAFRSNDINYLTFSRVGALIVIVGFFSVFIGLKHKDALSQSRAIYSEYGTRQFVQDLADVNQPERVYNRWVFGVTAFGTLIWGYGDIFLSKAVAWKWVDGADLAATVRRAAIPPSARRVLRCRRSPTTSSGTKRSRISCSRTTR